MYICQNKPEDLDKINDEMKKVSILKYKSDRHTTLLKEIVKRYRNKE
jgi:hypothetical protein